MGTEAQPVDGGLSPSETDRRTKAAIRAANVDERVYRDEWVGGAVVRRPGRLIGVKNGTRDDEWKRSIGFVAVERVKLKKFRDPARHFVKPNANIWSGIATMKRQCSTRA